MSLGVCRSDELRASRTVWEVVLQGPAAPEPHSSLAADDAVFPSLPCSSLAWTGIRTSVAAFDEALALLGGAGDPFDTEVLDHLREAFIHAAHAITVLAPIRSRRVDHALRIAWTAYSDPDARSASLTTYAPFPVPLVAREAAAILRGRQFLANPAWSDDSSARLAATLMMSRVGDPALFEATARFLWESTEDELHQAVRDDAVACAESVFAMITHAVSLWQRRGRPTPVAAPAPVAVFAGAAATPSDTSAFVRPAEAVDPFVVQVQGRRRLVIG